MLSDQPFLFREAPPSPHISEPPSITNSQPGTPALRGRTWGTGERVCTAVPTHGERTIPGGTVLSGNVPLSQLQPQGPYPTLQE